MKLTYRGVEYDYNPPVLETTLSETPGQYRGQTSHYAYVRHLPIPQPAERLCYRGVAYQTTRTGEIQQLGDRTSAKPALTNLANKLTGSSSAAQARRTLLKESSVLHQQSIARSLQHRIEIAKQKGNQPLLEQLEAEMRQNV
jgi:hypothetical protein